MPIPDAGRAIVSHEKVCDYLLNLDHPDGGSKAIWFGSLGYQLPDWRTVADDLLEIAKTCQHFDTERSPYGGKIQSSGIDCAYRPSSWSGADGLDCRGRRSSTLGNRAAG